ncbi:MAG: NINE protein [Pseudomonadota bacterium]
MARPEKSILTAYILWFFLSGIGVHRMYLKRTMSGLFLAMVNVAGMVMLAIGVLKDVPEYLMAGGTMVLAVVVWCLLDAFFIPGMVRHINEPDGERSYVSLGAVNMDPSFSATMAGSNQPPSAAKPKPVLPDDYEMPWRKPRDKPTVVRYRSED